MQIVIRVAVLLFVVLPLLATGGAIYDSAFSRYGPSFFNTLITDLVLIYLYGFAPGIITSLLHTQLTQQKKIAIGPRPRLRSAVYGTGIGLAAGLGLGLILSMVAAAIVLPVILAATVWGAVGGALYGALAGPAPSLDQRAA